MVDCRGFFLIIGILSVGASSDLVRFFVWTACGHSSAHSILRLYSPGVQVRLRQHLCLYKTFGDFGLSGVLRRNWSTTGSKILHCRRFRGLSGVPDAKLMCAKIQYISLHVATARERTTKSDGRESFVLFVALARRVLVRQRLVDVKGE